MLHFSRFQLSVILGICLLGFLLALPNFLPTSVRQQVPGFLPHEPVPLGLDLRGGAYLLLEADLDVAVRDRTNALLDDVRRRLRDEKIGYSGLSVASTSDAINVRIIDPQKLTEAVDALKRLVQPSGITFGLGTDAAEFDVTSSDDGMVTLRLSRAGREQMRQRVMAQSLEVVRRRVDPSGAREAIFTRQGERRVLVQVPGLSDTTELKKILNTVAKLTFHMVDESVNANDLAANRAPPGSEILKEEVGRGDQRQEIPIAIKSRAMITGDMLERAQGSIDGQTQRPVVSFKFNAQGARRFAEITRDNVGRRFAAVLDGKVITSPVINGPIPGGQGQIEGNFTMQEANELAVLLNAGALPVPLKVLEERTIGPELGEDAIAAGQYAALGGLLLVAGFMLLQYRLFGVFACVALIVNLILLLALMTIFRATLTLPGIAGFVLTMGMAVDANILIYERIKEEIRNGRTIISAIDAGFARAMATIIDANATHLLAGLIMLGFGSGPIGGFATALTLGIITSFFTSIFVTRLQVVWWLGGRRPATIPI